MSVHNIRFNSADAQQKMKKGGVFMNSFMLLCDGAKNGPIKLAVLLHAFQLNYSHFCNVEWLKSDFLGPARDDDFNILVFDFFFVQADDVTE